MAVIFKYNNQLFQCMNLQKKLKKMKIKDVEIIWEGEVTQSELEKKFVEFTNIPKEEKTNNTITYYKFYNPITKHTLTSIYKNVEEGWEFIKQYTIDL